MCVNSGDSCSATSICSCVGMHAVVAGPHASREDPERGHLDHMGPLSLNRFRFETVVERSD